MTGAKRRLDRETETALKVIGDDDQPEPTAAFDLVAGIGLYGLAVAECARCGRVHRRVRSGARPGDIIANPTSCGRRVLLVAELAA